ncbi:MAG: roadblock/LC7 domain-containing protein [Candidatus Heimdallarchaeota archaeon]
MPLSNNNAGFTKNLQDVLQDIVNSLNGIHAVTIIDTDGLLIEEINLEGTLGKESSLILCSLVAGINANMVTIGREIGSSPWVSLTSESENFKFFIRAVGSIAFLGVLTDPYVDMELLKLVIGPGVNLILQILEEHQYPKSRPLFSLSSLHISQDKIDKILEMS